MRYLSSFAETDTGICLLAIFKNYNLDVSTQLGNFALGMVSRVFYFFLLNESHSATFIFVVPILA
jgi:hypothetical protein